jgi:hypothetical protein
MQHQGEIIKKAVYKSGYTITKIAKDMGRSRSWLYHLFDNPSVPIYIMRDLGTIINHTFSEKINEMKVEVSFEKENIPAPQRKQSVDYWKDKYVTVLEEYNQLLKSKN